MYGQMHVISFFGTSLALIFIIFLQPPITAYSYDGFSVTKMIPLMMSPTPPKFYST